MTIDIITITYNNYSGLLKTSKSILFQNYIDINWIVIDGGSTDETSSFMHKVIANTNINITFISEEDNGIYDAMNKGINLSYGDYLIFLNAGDQFYTENVLSDIFLNIPINGTPSLVYGNFFRELKDGSLSPVKAKPIWYIYHSLPTSHQAIFYKREAIGQLRYNLKYKVSSDYYFTAKFIHDNNCINNQDYRIVPALISIFEYNGMSINNTKILYKDAFDVQKDIFKMNILVRLLSYGLKYFRNKFL